MEPLLSSEVPSRLKRLCGRWSMADFACFMGLAGGSSYQHFESEERQKLMPREHIEKLAAAIVGQGRRRSRARK